MSCFRLLDHGWCSFCGNDQARFRSLFASPLRDVAICDRCTLSSCDILGELLASWRGNSLRVRVPPPYYDAEFFEVVEAVVRGLEADSAGRSRGRPDASCSFCNVTGEQAIYLVSGPQVFVCEQCVAGCCREIASRVPEHVTLDEALLDAFPAVTIDRAMIDERSALWDAYLEYAELTAFEGKTWREIPTAELFEHSRMLGCAGDTLFRAVLPAYLRYLLHERHLFNDLPWQVAGQLRKRDAHPTFDRRVASFTPAQRVAICDVLELLATVDPIAEPMSEALATWKDLARLDSVA